VTATRTDPQAVATVDIPMLIRGRVIEPGEDAITFGGRFGARFRTPDPRKHAAELVLADAGALADLAALSVDAIVDFLVELGPRLALDTNPLMQAAFDLALQAGELTESVLAPIYEHFPNWFAREALERAVATVGRDYLDGWVAQDGTGGRGGGTRIRAVGTRNMHIIAGNVPVVAGTTVIRSALTKGDCLIKVPSNDPFTAMAIVRSMIDMAPEHPVTRHFAVAYWKGGDVEVERAIYRPSRIERLTAWGGSASMQHIQKYLVPGIELIAMNPKWSTAIVGREALDSAAGMQEAAVGVALMAGRLNQTACSSARVVYVECDADDETDLEKLEALGGLIHTAFSELPAFESSAPKRRARDLEDELDALSLEEDYYRVIGDAQSAGVVVSRTEDAVEFADRLANRVVNLVPVRDIATVPGWFNEATQTVGVYPESLRERLRDDLAIHGVQHIKSLQTGLGDLAVDDGSHTLGLPHDGGEPMRRMVRWTIDQG
jgi:hypothetical protein